MASLVIPPAPKLPWLDQIYVMRHQVEHHLDACFSQTPLPEGTDLLLFNEADAGFGDVAFATRLLTFLARHDPAAQLTLISSRPDKQRIFGLLVGVTLHGFNAFEGQGERPRLSPSIVVSAPGIFDHCRFGPPILQRLGL